MSNGTASPPPDLSRLIAAAQATTQALNNLNQTINSKFPNWVSVPASASAAGTAGQVSYDSTHFYVCIASSSWARVAIASW